MPADSVAWRVFRNPVALFVGGVTAVILELAEPRVRSGVWDHTTFRTDPLAFFEHMYAEMSPELRAQRAELKAYLDRKRVPAAPRDLTRV